MKKNETEEADTKEADAATGLDLLIEAGRMALAKAKSPRERMAIEEALQQIVAKQDRRRERRLH